jgi:hypothetical protein
VFAPLRTIRRDELLDMMANGAVRPDVDPDLVLDMINGAVLYRALMAEPLDEDVVDRIADIVRRSIEPEDGGAPD